MTLIVYWLQDGIPHHKEFEEGPNQIVDGLALCAELRAKECISHITTCSESSKQVGSNGVSGVVDGKLPDGSEYQWRKRRPWDSK